MARLITSQATILLLTNRINVAVSRGKWASIIV